MNFVPNDKVMSREDTLLFLIDKIKKKERLIISRYADGEFRLLNNKSIPSESSKRLSELLKKSICDDRQLVCVNYLKDNNIDKKDVWFKTQKFLVELANKDLFGCANWNVFDFQNGNIVNSYVFSGKVLLITGNPEESKNCFSKHQPNVEIFATPTNNASEKYETIRDEIINKVCENKFDNIVFSSGPIGKVWLTDIINHTNCNLIDMGATLNAIMNDFSIGRPMIKRWPMSWTNKVDVSKCAQTFFEKIRIDIREFEI